MAGTVGLFGAGGLWHEVYLLGILTWAGLEIAFGTNLFRRALGAAVAFLVFV